MCAASGGCVATRPSWQGETGFLLYTVAARAAPRGAAPRARRPAHGNRWLRRAAALAFACQAAAGCARPADAPGSGEQASAPASTGAATAVAVVDDAGRTVALPAPARRIISLIPTHTEAIELLAGGDVLLARTQWDIQPSLAHLPAISDALAPSIEWLAAQRPDLVIAWPDIRTRDLVRQLDDVGIPVYASRVESVAEIRSMVQRLGVLLDRQAGADSMVATIDAQLDSVRRFVAGRPRPSVLYLLNAEPPMAAGPGTFVHELIELCGGTNVFSDLRQLWPQVSLEEIVQRQPDVILRPAEGALADPLTGLAGRAGWRELRAVRNGRVHGIDPYFYNRPGATVGVAARGLAELIHGPPSVGGVHGFRRGGGVARGSVRPPGRP
jgi:iron complex transport system substrate-binding protein